MNANVSKLQSVILAAKGYNKATKARVLAQIPETVNDEQLWQALCNVEQCLKANAKYLKELNAGRKLLGKLTGLERHAYAPELNKLHLKNGTTINTPRCTDIDTAIIYAVRNNLIKLQQQTI